MTFACQGEEWLCRVSLIFPIGTDCSNFSIA